MTINLKNFLSDKRKMSKMGEFQELKQIDGVEISSISADLYGDGRVLFQKPLTGMKSPTKNQSKLYWSIRKTPTLLPANRA